MLSLQLTHGKPGSAINSKLQYLSFKGKDVKDAILPMQRNGRMKTIRRKGYLNLTLCGLALLIACDRIPDRFKPQSKPTGVVETTEITEIVELSVETLIDRMVDKYKRLIEEQQQKKGAPLAGLLDGTFWLKLDDFTRGLYITGVVNLASTITPLQDAAFEELKRHEKEKGLKAYFDRGGSYQAGDTAMSMLVSRISSVTANHSARDIIEAVTSFYLSKPLFKDKPVIWVLAVPLYKELQESKPQENKKTSNDSVSVPMKREVKH